jgi:hypothetical protein
MRNPLLLALGVLLPAIMVLLGSRPCRACSPGSSAADSALPAAGAQGVSPQTSVILVTGAAQVPAGLELLAGGVKVALPAIELIGGGLTAGGYGNFWRLNGALDPSTDYVVQSGDGAGAHEFTHFSTAATYDKAPGVSPQISRLRLWRVHYPVNKIAAGGCVFSEFEGYFALAFTPGNLPGTPAAEVVSVLSLDEKTGAARQQLVFSGTSTLPGGLVDTLSGEGVVLPEGGALSAPAALWKPELAPGFEYCATISIFGRNDRAAAPVQSNTVCASVTSLDAPGAMPATLADGGAGDAAGDGDAATSAPTAGGAGDAGGSDATASPAPKSGGCSIAVRGAPDTATALMLAAFFALACTAMRARRTAPAGGRTHRT